MPFRKGQSGNPNGKKPGPHRVTREVNKLAGADGPAIVKKIIAGAKRGDPFLQSLFIRFLLPKSKLIDTPVKRPPLASVQEAMARIADAVAEMERGELAFDEGGALIDGARAYVEARKTSELEQQAVEMRAEIEALKAEIETMVKGPRS
jgi:hypothetical protein